MSGESAIEWTGKTTTNRSSATAAARIGVSATEYTARLATGQKWCGSCGSWHIASDFGRDSSRGDGLATKCRAWRERRTLPVAPSEPPDRAAPPVAATVMAYLAGVIDSDGYITVHASTHKGIRYYAAQVGIAGTRRQPHDLAAAIWGGRVHRYEPKNPRHRAQFQWCRTGSAALPIIAAVLPYLLVKEEQAWLAIEVQEHVDFGRGDDPHPWQPAGYDPRPFLEDARAEMVNVLNQGRRQPLGDAEPEEVFDAATWLATRRDEFPTAVTR